MSINQAGYKLSCACGGVLGRLSPNRLVNRGVCYCQDCQAFAHFLGRADAILDAHGGTEVLQTSPTQVAFTQGVELLACMRLTSGGLLGWYASCCDSPIGNTPPNYQLSFVGLIRQFVHPEVDIESVFGPVCMRSHTGGGKGSPPESKSVVSTVIKFSAALLGARVTGRYKSTPFYSTTGQPVAQPVTLSEAERDSLMAVVG